MEPMQRKTITAQLKAVGDAGEFEAVIATLGVIDHDGDVIERGALAGQTVSIMPAHDSMSVPLGKATIEERGDDVIAVGQFNREVTAGKDWHEAIKFDLANPPAVQQWSWGYRIPEGGSHTGQLDGVDANFLSTIDTEEISPVLRGASIGTRTLSAKAHKTETSDAIWDVGAECVERHRKNIASDFDIQHHFSNGKASTRACVAGIIELNLAPGREGRAGVYDHLASHLKDAGIEPPELLEKPGVKLVDQVRLVTWQAESAALRLMEVASKKKGGLQDSAKVEAIEMATAVEDMTRVATKLAKMVDQLSPEDEVALALAGYMASEARRSLSLT